MGRYITSLLVLTAALSLRGDIYADESTRRVQEELRKRHLFYANATGEHSHALSAAVRHYQERKGFAPTGLIDPVTLASLGIVKTAAPSAARTPVAVGNRGDVRGANGETLPSYPPFLWPKDEQMSPFDPAMIGQRDIELVLTDSQHRPGPRSNGPPVGLIIGEDATGAPFDIDVELAQEPMIDIPRKPIVNRLDLDPPSDMAWGLGSADEERVAQAEVKSRREFHRRTRRIRPRKETNPIVLTYQTVDRTIRFLFGDAQPKRKRATTKRL